MLFTLHRPAKEPLGDDDGCEEVCGMKSFIEAKVEIEFSHAESLPGLQACVFFECFVEFPE